MIGESVEKLKQAFANYTNEQLYARVANAQRKPDPYAYLAMSEFAKRTQQPRPTPPPVESVAQQLLQGQLGAQNSPQQPPQGVPGMGATPQMPPQMPPQAVPQQPPQGVPGMGATPQMPSQGAQAGGYIHDYGVASLPYTPNYEHGGIVSFATGDAVGQRKMGRPSENLMFMPPDNPKNGGQMYYNSREELENRYGELPSIDYSSLPAQPTPVLGSKADPTTILGRYKNLFPEFFSSSDSKPTPVEPTEPAKPENENWSVTKAPEKTPTSKSDSSDSLSSIFDNILGPSVGGGAGAGNLQSMYSDFENKDTGIDERTARTEENILNDINKSRKLLKVDNEAYEEAKAKKLAAKKDTNKKDFKSDLWLKASKAFAGLASGRNWQEGIGNFATSFSEGAAEALADKRDRDDKLEAAQQALEDSVQARKSGDADLVYSTRQKEIEAQRAAKDKIAELKEARNTAIFTSKSNALLQQIQESGQDRRSLADNKVKLYVAMQEARSETAKLEAAYGSDIVKLAAAQLKQETPSAEEIANIKSNLQSKFSDQIDAWVKNNADSNGFVYLVKTKDGAEIPSKQMSGDGKPVGRPVNAADYYTNALMNDQLTALKQNYNVLRQMGSVYNSMGGGMRAGGIVSLRHNF